LGLTCSIRINIEETTEDREIGLMENKRRSFPETVVQTMLKVVLRSA
jgi:hypothetical protein